MPLNLSILFALALGGLVSFLVTLLVMKWRVLDHPNVRSSHTSSTPKAGGIGVITGVMVPLAIIALTTPGFGMQSTQGIALVLLGLLTGVLGLNDDLQELSATLKFPILALLALSAALWVYPVDGFALDHARIGLPLFMALGGTALWVFVMSNAVNFMDGSDGLVPISAMVAAAALAFLAQDSGQGVAVFLALALMMAVLGFLPLNIPPARIFLGDTGALFIGFWLASTALFYVQGGPPAAVYAVVLIFMPWLSDVLLTMAWRLMRRQNLLTAHNDHIYQMMLRHGMSHAKVAQVLALQTVVCGGLAWVFRSSATSELLALGAVASLAVIGHWWARAALGTNPASGDNGSGTGR